MGYLPTPPDDGQKYSYLNQNKFYLYTFGLISFLLLVSGMTVFSLSHAEFYWFLIFATLIFFYLIVSYVVGIFGKPFDFENHKKIILENSDFAPSVDIYLPNCGEDMDILSNTWKYVSQLEYSGKINIYVLDDKGRDEVELLAKEYNFHYISRPNKGELKKAGNLRYAFARTSGDFILILDADFCPRKDYLKEVVPYMKDATIAVLQTPQFFNVDDEQFWVEKGAGYIQELFYRVIQVNRNTWGASICVGTNALYRREALEPFGGTAAIGYSEDLHTGFNCLSMGWKIKYIPINLAKGICPDTVSSFFIQQYRWAMGSTSLFLNSFFWKTKLSIMARICYLSGMFYYSATALGIFITPIPGILMVWLYPENVFWYNWFFSVPSLIYGTVFMAFWSKFPFGVYALKTRIISYYAHFFAIIDKLKNTAIPWVPSGAKEAKKNSRYADFVNLLYFWTLGVFLLSLSGAIVHMHGVFDYNFYPVIFFSAFNYYIGSTILRDQNI